MEEQFQRAGMLLTNENIDYLHTKTVAIFGVGGVGGYVVEGLVRTGIGHFILIDNDEVNLTNLNRQIIATHKSIGRKKVEVAKERILDINPNATVEIKEMFYLPENADELDLSKVDYIVDAIDTVVAKCEIAKRAEELNIPAISSMGTGNKINGENFIVTDIYKTKECPLAKAMRSRLRKMGVKKLKVVYSEDTALKPIAPEELQRTPGSVAWPPSIAGMLVAGEVIKDLIKK